MLVAPTIANDGVRTVGMEVVDVVAEVPDVVVVTWIGMT
jgi:hypothetical protein